MPPKKREIPSSILFPVNPKKGDRGTTYGNKETFAAAVEAVDPKEAEKVRKEKDWRHQYPKYIVKQVALSLQSPDKALKVAEAGLAYAYKNFEFKRGEETMSLEAAMAKFKTHNYGTGVIQGTGKKPTHGAEVTIPYKPFGTSGPSEPLKGEKLRAQVRKWAEYGTIEPSARDAIEYLIDNPKALDLSDKYFVLIGASSAMGPFLTLLALGANIIALDIPFAGIWKDRLIAKARASPGRIIFPTKNKADIKGMSDDEIAAVAGCDLLNEAPEIRNWLLDVEKGKELIVGAYAYLDGDLFVKLSLAMDAIIKDLTEKRQATPAYLCTPTDVHVIGQEAHEAAKANHSSLSLVSLLLKLSPLNLVPGALVKNALKPVKADNGENFYMVDGIVNRQGPNYALAKRIQHWRAMVAHSKTGVNVSSNIAPSTATVSVTSNWLFALAYKGWHFFKPLEVFNEDTSNAVMAAALIHDVQNPNAPVHPKNKKLRNPLEVFYYGSLHGGIWRCGYKIDSVGEAAALLYLLTTPGGLVFVVSFFVALCAIAVHFVPGLKEALEAQVLPLLNIKK